MLGWPVSHSRSPAMMRAAGLQRYQRLPVAPGVLHDTVRALGAAGFHGANVTIPHKEAALAIADTASDAAREIGAANTLTFGDDGSIAAENTDAPGLLAALGGTPPATALVLGAGGSARAVVWALTHAGTAVSVWNRTPQRARALGVPVVQRPVPAELLVNCTSVGLDRSSTDFKDLALDADGLSEYTTVVDLVYGAGGTSLIQQAAERGLHTVDGLEILVSQGALSFTLWTGLPAPLQTMRAAVEDKASQPRVPRAHPHQVPDRRSADPGS